LSSQASLQAQRHRMARRRRSGAALVWIGLALLALVALIGVAGVIALRGGLRP
jgi:Tfp pilus assembly protein PilX